MAAPRATARRNCSEPTRVSGTRPLPENFLRSAWARKIEAIDPKSDFWWIDDNPSEHDRAWLRAHHRQDRLIEASSDRGPEALLTTRSRLPGRNPFPRTLWV